MNLKSNALGSHDFHGSSMRCFGCQCMAAFPGLWLANGTFSKEFPNSGIGS